MADKVTLITGGSGGIGKATAIGRLGRRLGWHRRLRPQAPLPMRRLT